jgi:transcriptional regulator with XRE-family HTH domain
MLDILDKRVRAGVFRDRLAAAMAEAGTSRAALARAVGIDRSTVTQMLSNEDVRMPGGHVVANMATVLGVSCDWLLGLSDRPERVSALIDTSLSISDAGRATGADDQIFAWHEEAAGYKIRHVPATLPDVLKTDALMEWEYAPAKVKPPGRRSRRPMRGSTGCAARPAITRSRFPLHEFESFVAEQAITPGWPGTSGASSCAGSPRSTTSFSPACACFSTTRARVFRAAHDLRPAPGGDLCRPPLRRLPRPGAGAGHEPPFRLARAGGDGVGPGFRGARPRRDGSV